MAPKTRGALWAFLQFQKLTYSTNGVKIPDADLTGKWIVITGGNSGIGRDACLQFAKWGANIVMGCRQPPPHEPKPDDVVAECKTAAKTAGHVDSSIEWWECDMSSFASVETFGKRWLEKDLPLDILANNAGIPGQLGDKLRLTGDGNEFLHQINFLSHTLLTHVLLPSLAKAPHPRIICTTSNMQFVGKFDLENANKGADAYQNNKLYFQTWLTALQARLAVLPAYKHVSVIGVHPGYVITNIWKPPFEDRPRDWGLQALGQIGKLVGITSQQGSLAITNAATAKDCGIESRTAKVGDDSLDLFRNRIWRQEPMPQTYNPEYMNKTWDYAAEKTGLQEKGLLKVFEA